MCTVLPVKAKAASYPSPEDCDTQQISTLFFQAGGGRSYVWPTIHFWLLMCADPSFLIRGSGFIPLARLLSTVSAITHSCYLVAVGLYLSIVSLRLLSFFRLAPVARSCFWWRWYQDNQRMSAIAFAIYSRRCIPRIDECLCDLSGPPVAQITFKRITHDPCMTPYWSLFGKVHRCIQESAVASASLQIKNKTSNHAFIILNVSKNVKYI